MRKHSQWPRPFTFGFQQPEWNPNIWLRLDHAVLSKIPAEVFGVVEFDTWLMISHGGSDFLKPKLVTKHLPSVLLPLGKATRIVISKGERLLLFTVNPLQIVCYVFRVSVEIPFLTLGDAALKGGHHASE